MSHRETVDAVVLRTIDIGEADRFCVLLTREKGRLAARAKAVRKPGSRMGGCLLPLRRVNVEIHENGDHLLIIGATDKLRDDDMVFSFGSFLRSSQGIDVLLSLIEDNEPLPAVFDLLCAFLRHASEDDPGVLTAFQARLLHLLGLLPSDNSDQRVVRLPDAARAFLRAAVSPLPFSALAELVPSHAELPLFLNGVIDEHASRPLKSRDVVTAF
jgi:DNA repair protein RecO (recombination protein O)